MEDLGIDVLLTGPLRCDEVFLSWQNPAPLSALARARIENRWAHYVSEATPADRVLFNGPVTALAAFASQPLALLLQVFPSDYKTFLVTTLRDHDWFKANAAEAIASALGNSVLLTHGGRAALGVRSAKMAAYAGFGHLFGGVLDMASGARLTGSGILLQHLRRELREELGLEARDLSGDPTLLGLARDRALHQPELIWQWELCSPPETLRQGLNKDEHDRVLILENLKETTARLTPASRLAITLWRQSRTR